MITVDSNVLVCPYDDDEPERQAAAVTVLRQLLLTKPSAIGLQAVGELHNVLRKKLKLAPWEAAEAGRNALTGFGHRFSATEAAVQDALAYASAGRLSYWDALLLASARDAGCSAILSEDMHPGRLLDVEIVRPFDRTGAVTDRAKEMLDL